MKIRQLQEYSSDDDPDSSVQIQALPGSIINVTAATAAKDSEPPIVRKSKAVRIIAAIVGALISCGAIAKAMWDATH